MIEADLELAKPVRQALIDSTLRSCFKRRSLRSSKAGGRSGFLLTSAIMACILLYGTRLVLNFTNSHSNRTRRYSQVKTPFTAAAQFDEDEGQLRDHAGTVEASGTMIAVLPDEKPDREMHLVSKEEESLVLNDVAGARADLEERLGDEGMAEGKRLARAHLERGEETRASEESTVQGAAEEIETSAEAESVHSVHPEKKDVPDAISFLERLTVNLTKTESNADDGPYHNRRIFEIEYAEMKRNIKIFVYPTNSNDPYINIFTPTKEAPSGNYASEEFFQQALSQSGFVTPSPSRAHFFFMPVSITKARQDTRIAVAGLQAFCAEYVTGVRENYGHWNRSGGADHFYLSCHSIARSAMNEVPFVRENAIQLLCPSSYYLNNYITHKDASVPQIWPRPEVEEQELRRIDRRTRLAFFAGTANSPVRRELVKVWGDDDKVTVHEGKVPFPYAEGFMTSKFCLQAKGFEVNTARLGDSLFYGCVPVIVADYYDLPWQDILDWSKFSVVVTHADIPLLRARLEEVSDASYAELQRNVMVARKHFIWHSPAHEHDAFHTVMYELWKRRHVVRRPSQ